MSRKDGLERGLAVWLVEWMSVPIDTETIRQGKMVTRGCMEVWMMRDPYHSD